MLFEYYYYKRFTRYLTTHYLNLNLINFFLKIYFDLMKSQYIFKIIL